MLKWFKGLWHRALVRRYVRELGPSLKKNYGPAKHYSPQQVRKTVAERGIPESHIYYGYAIFLNGTAFDAVHQEMGEACDYQAMRQEIGDLCFSGRDDFTVPEVIDYGESHGGGDSGHGDSDGGDGGGNGGD